MVTNFEALQATNKALQSSLLSHTKHLHLHTKRLDPHTGLHPPDTNNLLPPTMPITLNPHIITHHHPPAKITKNQDQTSTADHLDNALYLLNT